MRSIQLATVPGDFRQFPVRRGDCESTGFHTPDATTTTLLDALSHIGWDPHDPYLVQAVTAYLNSLDVDVYAFDAQAVLDGYHGGANSEGSCAWHNHGATSQFVVPSCPLSSTKGFSD